MREKAHCCPNCDAVMVLRYDPDEAVGKWHECPFCGYRTDVEGFRSVEDEDAHKRPYAR